MGLTSSLNAGVAGLNVNASKLSTVSDNIANSGTNGYKRATVDFSSVVIGQSAGSYNAGGVRVTTGREVDVRGALVTSSNATDIAISGRGLLPVTPVNNRLEDPTIRPLQLVSTGSFSPDEEGYLRTSSGLQLLGWPTDTAGNVSGVIRGSAASLEPVNVSGFDFASNPTTAIDLGINLPSTETQDTASGDTLETGIEYFDELGDSQQLTVAFTPTIPAVAGTASNEWDLTISDSGTGGVVGQYTLVFRDTNPAAGYLESVTTVNNAGGTGYDTTTGVIDLPVAGTNISLNIGLANTTLPATATEPSGPMTQFATDFAPLNIVKDGTPVGGLSRVEINESGRLEAIYDTGFRQTIFQIPIGNVPNMNGLTALDNQAFEVSPTSGSIYFWDAGTGPVGDILGFAIEQSATDVAQELTALIETQRAYSSNATVVQTVDEMLQETTSLGR